MSCVRGFFRRMVVLWEPIFQGPLAEVFVDGRREDRPGQKCSN